MVVAGRVIAPTERITSVLDTMMVLLRVDPEEATMIVLVLVDHVDMTVIHVTLAVVTNVALMVVATDFPTVPRWIDMMALHHTEEAVMLTIAWGDLVDPILAMVAIEETDVDLQWTAWVGLPWEGVIILHTEMDLLDTARLDMVEICVMDVLCHIEMVDPALVRGLEIVVITEGTVFIVDLVDPTMVLVTMDMALLLLAVECIRHVAAHMNVNVDHQVVQVVQDHTNVDHLLQVVDAILMDPIVAEVEVVTMETCVKLSYLPWIGLAFDSYLFFIRGKLNECTLGIKCWNLVFDC